MGLTEGNAVKALRTSKEGRMEANSLGLQLDGLLVIKLLFLSQMISILYVNRVFLQKSSKKLDYHIYSSRQV